MRIALVHERFTEFTGSEAVVQQFCRIWPGSTVHVPLAKPGVAPATMSVRSTQLDHLYFGGGYAHLLPLLPLAMRRLRIDSADAILASHHAFANQVVMSSDLPVLSYVHSPARWMWDPQMRAREPGGAAGRLLLSTFSALERGPDRAAAQRLTAIMANSSAVADRIERWWGRESTVINPPVDVEFYTPDDSIPREEFFLFAGRLVPYKRPDLAIAAAERTGLPIVVAGEGRAIEECRTVAGPNTSFVGRVSDAELRDLYRRCKALLMPGEEDFGIVPVEAQACGAPVIALGTGGALDYVVDGVTGVLCKGGSDDQRVEALASAMHDLSESDFDSRAIRSHAERFSPSRFRLRVGAFVKNALS